MGQTTSPLLNSLAYAMANQANDVTAAATGDLFPIIDVSDGYQIKYADASNVMEVLAITATAAEINAAADVSARVVSVPDANTPITAGNSGKPHFIANVSADRTFTLPAAAAGLEYEFIATVGAADGHDWIITTGSDTNFFIGSIVHLDTDSAGAGTEVVNVIPNGSTHSKLQVNLPQGATWVRMICNGTNWCVWGNVVSATAPAFADQ